MKKEDLYDINSYTEKELYEVLDLDEPSDRELEAKILMMIHKYEQMSSTAGKKLVSFFEKVYDHFFESEEEEVVEGLVSMEDAVDILNLSEDEKAKWVKIPDEEIIRDGNENNVNEEERAEKLFKVNEPTKSEEEKPVIYTKEIDYIKGEVNPILKKTTQRIISIDSQYRSDKTTMPTEFTFNLSEPLKDVVSLRLYSVQIPYTWYTIGKSFGSNFIMFKGKTSGIDNATHDIKIEIDPGNYRAEELKTVLNTQIQTVNNEIDATIGSSYLEYNAFTTVSSFIVDIDNHYNESAYRVEFPTWSSPYDTTRNTISSYFGFETKSYDLNVLKSPLYYGLPVATSTDITSFVVDAGNNTITVNQYYGTIPFVNGESIIDVSTNIVLTNGTYTRTALLSHMNTKIIENLSLYDSYIQRKNIDASNNDYISAKSYIELKLKFKRTVMNPQLDSKTVVIFPDNPDIWIGNTSCFRFDSSYNELSYICAELPPVAQNDTYKIENSPYVILKSNVLGFANKSINDLSFSLIDSTETGYSMTEYIKKINESIRDADSVYNTEHNNAISGNIVAARNRLYAPDESYVYNAATATEPPEGTYAYLKENRFNLHLKVSRDFDRRMYKINLAGGIFDTTTYGNNTEILKLKDSANVILSSNIIDDLTQEYGIEYDTGKEVYVDENQIIFTVKPKVESYGNEGSEDYTIYLVHQGFQSIDNGVYTYSSLSTLITAMNNTLSEYIDKYNHENVFDGTEFNFTTDTINANYDASLNIQINKRLIPINYNIQLVDGTNDSWESYLKVDSSMTDTSYDLSHNVPNTLTNNDGVEVLKVYSNGEAQIISPENVAESNPITIQSGINDRITIHGYENGVYSATNENNIDIVVPSGIYSTSFLIDKINEVLLTTNSLINKNNSQFELVEKNGNKYVRFYGNFKRKYTAADYNIVFYDTVSFAKCFVGAKSVQNTTWDTTIGWILGFREFTVYDISLYYNDIRSRYQIIGDTGVNTDLFNYFLLCLDDYNQNHLNDGLITVTGEDNSIPLPSYANRSEFQCDPTTGEFVYNNTTGLTEKQVYAANEIKNASNNTSIGTSVSTSSYGRGPYVSNVFGLIPLKVGNLTAGSSYVEFGGTLQNQERSYFGPVNIQRMTVKLVSDRGNVVDLNNANWSFSLICETVNKLE